jgi:gamma-glutamyltranspeptidase
MEKQTIIEDMNVKLNEVLDAQDTVSKFLDEIEETVASGERELKALQDKLVTTQDALSNSIDMSEAKATKAKINKLAEEIELQMAVNTGKTKVMYSQLEDKIESFFLIHKGAKFFSDSVDAVFVNNTTLATLIEDKETMISFTNSLYNSFGAVRGILLDTKIVPANEQNLLYRGTHLGQHLRNTELIAFENLVRPYMGQLKAQGKLS